MITASRLTLTLILIRHAEVKLLIIHQQTKDAKRQKCKRCLSILIRHIVFIYNILILEITKRILARRDSKQINCDLWRNAHYRAMINELLNNKLFWKSTINSVEWLTFSCSPFCWMNREHAVVQKIVAKLTVVIKVTVKIAVDKAAVEREAVDKAAVKRKAVARARCDQRNEMRNALNELINSMLIKESIVKA